MLSPAPDSIKASANSARWRPLAGFSLLACSGPDAAGFLQAQLMNDLRALAVGHWQWNGWLTAKGRVVCLFALWRRAENEFVAILPDFPAVELQGRLQRFVFRSKLSLQVLEEFTVAGELDAGCLDVRDRVEPSGPALRFDFGGDRLQRSLLLLPAAGGTGEIDREMDATWLEQDIAHGLPRLPDAQRETWTPQMLSLQRLRAFSLTKGCYPGQEIVARTHYLGQAKRELARLQGEALAAGGEVTDAHGRPVGSIVCVDHSGHEALAVLSVARAGPLRAGAGAAVHPALGGGLQRPV